MEKLNWNTTYTSVSGVSTYSWEEEIDGLRHLFTFICVNDLCYRTDEVDYNNKRIPFSEYKKLIRDEKIEKIIN